MIQAKVIADSKNEFDNRITTMVVTFPRIILAELNTHRMLSKNSASSRAIPTKKMIKMILDNPFVPIAWQKEHTGMQGFEYYDNEEKFSIIDLSEIMFQRLRKMYINTEDNTEEEISDEVLTFYNNIFLNFRGSYTLNEFWLLIRNKVLECVLLLYCLGVTKQLCNRLLEPFMWHTVIVTATEWENFFHLRCPQYWCNTDNSIHKSKKDWIKHRKIESDRIDKLDEGQATVSFSKGFTKPTNEEWLFLNKGQAEIHMMALAEAMYDALNESTPKKLKAGEWHIPFGDSIKEPKLYSLMASKYGEGLPQPEWSSKFWNMKIQIAIAMCARVSYTVVGEEGKEPNYENDIKLHDRLLKSGHASPFEHVAQSSNINEISGNFLGGWKQYRKILGL